MIGQRLFVALLLSGMMFPLEGCEADMTAGKSERSTNEALDGRKCSFHRENLKPIRNVHRLLLGKAIKQNSCDTRNFVQFEERFYRDGTWKYYEFGAVLAVYDGKWRVEGDKVVTENQKIGKFSRNILENESNTLFMESIAHTRLDEDVKIVPIVIHDISRSYGGNP